MSVKIPGPETSTSPPEASPTEPKPPAATDDPAEFSESPDEANLGSFRCDDVT